jgi:hypothetical protein
MYVVNLHDCPSFIEKNPHADVDRLAGSAAPAPSGSPSQTAAPTLQGYLLKFTEGFFYNSWAKQYFKVADNVLHCLASESQTESAEQVLLEKVTSVYEATNIDNAPNCFKVSTATRTWTLRANSPEELNHWITTLDGMIKALRALRGDNGDDEFVSPDSGNTVCTILYSKEPRVLFFSFFF